MSSLNNFIRKLNNVTRTVNTVNTAIRAVRSLRNQFRGGGTSRPTRPVPRPSGSPSPQPQAKPLGLTPVSRPSTGRNTNKKPVRPTQKASVGPKVR